MKFTISTILLADLTKQVAFILDPKKSVTNSGKYIKISAKDNFVSLEVVHEQASLIVRGEASIFEEGVVGVSGKMFSDIIEVLTSEYVTLSINSGSLKIQSERRIFNLGMFDVQGFIPSPNHSSGEFFKVDNFFKAVSKVSHCTVKDEGRAWMGCILVKKDTVAATDGKRLAVYKFSCPIEEIMTVPYEWLQPFRKVFHQEDVEICMLNSSLHFKQGTTYGSIRLLEKVFPNVENVIPKGNGMVAEIGKQELLAALRSAKIVSTSDCNIVKLTFINHELKLSIATTAGQMDDIVPCSFEKEYESLYNLDFLIDALKKLDDEVVSFTLRPGCPAVIKELEYTQVIMPVQK